MQIVLNHVTRMAAPRICIAGVERKSGRHVRPTTAPTELLTRRLLTAEGGFVTPGAVVELGAATTTPNPPEVEDCRVSLDAIRSAGQLDGARYLTLLERVAEESLEAIFGDVLVRPGRNFAVEPGHGIASLGVLRVRTPPELEVDGYGKVAVRLTEYEPAAYVKVTDVRFVEADHRTAMSDRIDDVNGRVAGGVPAYLMVGLSRPFPAARNLHWLQVNGICLADRPLGERP
jgi:hypothetical protein